MEELTVAVAVAAVAVAGVTEPSAHPGVVCNYLYWAHTAVAGLSVAVFVKQRRGPKGVNGG